MAGQRALSPPLPWQGGVIFGWNSWAAYEEGQLQGLYGRVRILQELPAAARFQNGGSAYLNLDSFWDNLTPAQLAGAVRRRQCQRPEGRHILDSVQRTGATTWTGAWKGRWTGTTMRKSG